MTSIQPKLIYLVAGEPSGDFLASQLMTALHHKYPGEFIFTGVGGPLMEQQGLQSLFPMADLAVMGLTEVLPRLPTIVKRLYQTVRHIKAVHPQCVITFDAPDFCFRVAKRLRKIGIPLVHYTAPQVWAWRPGRAKKVAKIYDHLLTLFAFEPAYFEPHGLKCTFVGHPLIEKQIAQIPSDAFRQKYHLSAQSPILCVLPGSRQGEMDKLLTIFAQTAQMVAAQMNDLTIVVPTLSHLKAQVVNAFKPVKSQVLVVTDARDKYAAMRASQAALAASGTVTLELALAGTPTVAAFKVGKLTEWIVRFLLKISHVTLPNILLKKAVIPECLQDQCNPQVLAQKLLELMQSADLTSQQRADFEQIRPLLDNGMTLPSLRAAEVIHDICH